MTDSILKLSQLGYRYAGGEQALSGVDLCLHPGERVVLLGSNGAGKSTLFLLCSGVLTPTDGQILLDNQAVSGKDKALRRLRRSVGLVFQDPDDQLLGATVESEISFGPMNLDLPVEAVQEAVDEAVTAMNLEALRERPPQYLSGGEKKRVSIADILAMHARILLLDEPTASLDPAHTSLLEQTLAQLHEQGLTLLVSTHDVNFAWRWAERAVVLADGKLLADGPVYDIFADAALLKRAGLQKPLLYRAAELLFPAMPCRDFPRTIQALEDQLGQTRM